MNQRKPEILAPAGSISALRAAVAAGADAVYIGGSRFGARAYAESTQTDSLLSALDYAHQKGRKVYLTVNTLLKEQELSEELYEFVRTYYEGGVDAVIVQDVGVLHFLATHFPKLPLHASTQMTIVSGDGAAMFSGYPVTRIVPARELSLEEIKQLRHSTSLELETFVHGALCYCYSGQCLFSSMLGGRSGNRGRCAQPCRMPYMLHADGKKVREDAYLLSPKDLCTIDRLPELISAGIDSFKIEGRMKSAEYAAGVTAAYRQLTDLYFEYGEKEYASYLKKNPQLLKEQIGKLGDLYNRGGFTEGYYFHFHGPGMMSMERPNHSGLLVGEVASAKGSVACIRFHTKVRPQDVLEIRTPQKENYEFTVGRNGFLQETLYQTNVARNFPLSAGLPVYRTKNDSLLKELGEAYGGQFQSAVQGTFTAFPGEKARLSVSMGTQTVTVEGVPVLEAKSQPVTKEKIEEQLKKTGESEFYFDMLSVQVGEHSFLPMGSIKELRRQAFAQLAEKLANAYRRKPVKHEVPEKVQLPESKTDTHKSYKHEKGREPELVCLVSSREQWNAVAEIEEVSEVYLDLQNEPLTEQFALARETERKGKRAFLVLPHIFRQKERIRYEQAEKEFLHGGFSGFLAKSLEELAFLKAQDACKNMETRLNYNLYVYNREAKQFFLEQGYSHFTAPAELNAEELEIIGIEDCDFLMYGRLPLMVSAQCLRDNLLTCTQGKAMGGLVITDRMGAEFPVQQVCTSCYNIIYNSVCFSLLGRQEEVRKLHPRAYRLDFTLESYEETRRVLSAFLAKEVLSASAGEVYTKGHWKRGID